MTIGSAASLPGHGQEAPFPSFRSYRRNSRLPATPRLATASAPQKQLPRIALTDDPPRGRILVVADDAPLVLDVQRILRDAGYRAVGPAGSAAQVGRLAGPRPIDGAVIDLQLHGESAVAAADRLASEGIPFVWLTDGSETLPEAHEGVPTVTKPLTSEALVRALERAMSSEQPSAGHSFYPVPPPQQVWPRVFPQL